MVRKAFSGDLLHELPKGKIEPYRLWFEYLKLALQLYPARVDRSFYEGWGDVENAAFDDWFKENLKRLFAVPASVSLLMNDSEIAEALAEADALIIKVKRTAPVRRQIADFAKALKTLPKVQKVSKDPVPQFMITSKRSMNLANLRSMLRFLKLLQEHRELEDAAKAYYEWAVTWNENIKRKKWKRSLAHIPAPITRFIRERKRIDEERKSKPNAKRSTAYINARSDLRRFQRSAEKVVVNVAKGRFPGDH